MSNDIGGHAFLPPSGAPVWVVCAMWPTMTLRYPEIEPQQESIEGTASHWVNVEFLSNRVPKEGDRTPQGIVVDEEMLEAADTYIDAIRKSINPEVGAHIEEHIVGRRIHDEKNAGTPDLWTFDKQALVLDVFDYKYGHEYVEVFENWQLINYTALILEKLGVFNGTGPSDESITVRLHVVQPRTYTPAGPHRTWTVKADELRTEFNILQAAARRATATSPEATVNLGCKHCPGRHACTALQRAGGAAADLSLHSLPVELPPEAVGLELKMLSRAAKLLAARITGLEEQAVALIRAGTLVPWWQMESVQGRENWGKPIEEILALGQMLSVDVSKPGVITPNQARKKGLLPEVVAAYTAPRGNALKLAPVDNAKAKRVFG